MVRILDIGFASLAVIVLAPIMLPVAVLLRITGEGEVFYKQMRVGLDRKQFGLLKFATMIKNSENLGAGTVTLKNDSRVLPVAGYFNTCPLVPAVEGKMYFLSILTVPCKYVLCIVKLSPNTTE